MSRYIELPNALRARIVLSLLLAVILIFVVSLAVETAHQVQRPATGPLNQTYLWGAPGIPSWHRGIDFLVNTGTSVYAVADGKVVDLEDTRTNGEEESINGNFVVIQHSKKHYDFDSGANSYVYSI